MELKQIWNLINENLEEYLLVSKQEIEDYICSVCLNLLHNPVLTPCGHHFCKKCIDEILKNKEPSCPIDRENLTGYSPFINKHLQRKINHIKIKCPQYKLNCNWKGEIDSLEKHFSQCDYFLLKCEFKCNQIIERKNYKEHIKTFCPERTITCIHCNKFLVAKTLNEHLLLCSKIEIQCPLVEINCIHCNLLIIRNILDYHLNECSMIEVVCKGFNCGLTVFKFMF